MTLLDPATATAKSVVKDATDASFAADVLAVHGLEEMRRNNISQLVVANNNIYAGIIHLHDLVKEGII